MSTATSIRHKRWVGLVLTGLLLAGLGVQEAAALTTEELLEQIQRKSFDYFWFEANPTNGLVRDRSTATSPCSIAATGFGLSAI